MRELKGEWRDLFNGFSVALDLKKLMIGFIGVVLSLGIYIAGPIFLANVTNRGLWEEFALRSPASWCNVYCSAWQVIFTFPLFWQSITIAVLYLLLVVIWSYCGGVITRIAAINLTKDEGLELSKASSFAGKKYLAYFSPWIVCILGFFFFWLWNFLGGLAGRIPYVGEFLITIFLPLAILSGFIMLFIFIGSLFGATMFFPTISVEGSDSFDALSRSFSYLYAKPWHYFWYQLVAFVYGAITTAFVWAFGYFMIVVSLWAGAVGMGGKFTVIANYLNIGGQFAFFNSITGLDLAHNWLPPPDQNYTPITAFGVPIAPLILAVWLLVFSNHYISPDA